MNYRQQTAFWIIVFVGLTVAASLKSGDLVQSFFFICILLPVVMGTSYWFNSVLVPTYLLRKRYWRFGIYLVYTLIISIYLEMVVITFSFILLAQYQYGDMPPMAYDVFGLTVVLYLVVLVNTSIVLINRIHKEQVYEPGDTIPEEGKFLIVQANRRRHQIPFEDIEYFESIGDYVRIFIDSRDPLVSKLRISHLESTLPPFFLRIHRSFIINRNKTTVFNKIALNISGVEIPISRTYRDHAFKVLSTQSKSITKENGLEVPQPEQMPGPG